MKLIDVMSATASPHKGVYTLRIRADIGNGDEEFDYGWAPDDPHGLAPQITEWMKAHKDFPLQPYVAPPVSGEQVKAEAARRIEAIIPRWMIDREMTGGTPVPQELKDAAATVRTRSGEIEAMESIPQDYVDDKYWS